MLILLVELHFQRISGLIYLVFSTFDIPIPFKKIVFLMLTKKLRNLNEVLQNTRTGFAGYS